MSKGTISANILNRSITRHVVKKSSAVIRGVGGDAAIVKGAEYMVSASGFADEDTAVTVTPGAMAEIIAENSLMTVGVAPEYMNIFITASEDCSEDKLRHEMNELTSLAKNRGIAIIGGNTAFSGKGEGYSVTINLLGTADEDRPSEKAESSEERMSSEEVASSEKGMSPKYLGIDPRKKARPGDYIFVTGNAGHFGISQLIIRHYDKLRKRFAGRYLDAAVMDSADYRIERLKEAYLIHDVSYGGVYRSLYDLAEWTGLGISILHEELPIRQDTIEICEELDINPYCLLGIGESVGLIHESELDNVKNSDAYKCGKLHIAGRLTEKKEKIVSSDLYKMRRFLTPYSEDEIYKER